MRWVSHVLKGIPLRTNRHFVCFEELFPAGVRSGYSDTPNPPAAEFESHLLTFSQGNQPENSLGAGVKGLCLGLCWHCGSLSRCFLSPKKLSETKDKFLPLRLGYIPIFPCPAPAGFRTDFQTISLSFEGPFHCLHPINNRLLQIMQSTKRTSFWRPGKKSVSVNDFRTSAALDIPPGKHCFCHLLPEILS